VAIDARHEPVI